MPTPPKPNLTITTTTIANLTPATTNPRTHTEPQLNELAQSIRRFGFTAPILIDQNNNIIAGHARTEAARRAGLTDVPALIATNWTDPQRRAYLLFDNQVAQLSTWDKTILRQQLTALAAADIDFTGLGFDLNDFLPSTAADEPPTPTDTPTRSATGDTWQLGPHRLIAGNGADATTVAHALATDTPDLLVTAPGDHRPAADITAALQHYPATLAYVWTRHYAITEVQAVKDAGFELITLITWPWTQIEVAPDTDRQWYHHSHSICLYIARKGCTPPIEATIWHIKSLTPDPDPNPRRLPVDAAARPIKTSSPPGGIIFDPFAGAGHTIFGADEQGRRCIAIEDDLHQVDIILARWEQTPNNTATKLQCQPPKK